MNPSSSTNDVRAYLHAARLQLRTKRDIEVEGKFQQEFDLLADAQQIFEKLRQEQATIDEAQLNTTLLGQGSPQPLAESHAAFVKSSALLKEFLADSPDMMKRRDADTASARRLDAEVRVALGLSAIK
jgi:hypothetical protein